MRKKIKNCFYNSFCSYIQYIFSFLGLCGDEGIFGAKPWFGYSGRSRIYG